MNGGIQTPRAEKKGGMVPQRKTEGLFPEEGGMDTKKHDYRNQQKNVKEGDGSQHLMTQRLKNMESEWTQCTLDM